MPGCVILPRSRVALHPSARAETVTRGWANAPESAETVSPACAKALERAGTNRAELESALAQASPSLRPHLEWLIGHMPEADLRTVKRAFLAPDAQQAPHAGQSAPLREPVGVALCRDAILPHDRGDATRPDRRNSVRDVHPTPVG